MAAGYRTSEFREILREKERDIPEAKRRKISRTAKRIGDEQKDVQETLNKEYITEGYNIVRMSSLRKPVWFQRLKRLTAEPHKHTVAYAGIREETIP